MDPEKGQAAIREEYTKFLKRIEAAATRRELETKK